MFGLAVYTRVLAPDVLYSDSGGNFRHSPILGEQHIPLAILFICCLHALLVLSQLAHWHGELALLRLCSPLLP